MFKKLFLALAMVLLTSSMAIAAMDVTLAWDPNDESDLAGYKIYVGTTYSGPYDVATHVIFLTDEGFDPANPEFTVVGLDENVRYYFVATAFDTEPLESEYSNEVNTSSVDNTPPKAPILRIFRWILSLFTGGLHVAGVDVYPDWS